MTTLLEASKDALKFCEWLVYCLDHECGISPEGRAELDKQLPIIRAAIEQEEAQSPFAWHHPVEGLSYENYYTDSVPLYTSLQPQEWVNLTDDDIKVMYVMSSGYGGDDYENFARTIEHLCKEKNQRE